MAMLTTSDNPFNPYNDFDKWYDYDCNVLGYNTCAYLSRIVGLLCEDSKVAKRQDFVGDYDSFVTDTAIDEILKYDFTKLYKKVEKSD